MPLRSLHYTLFELPLRYNVDVVELALRYRELQRAVHPDRHSSASESERLLAVRRAAELNDAYQTLKDPINRARHLLLMHGIAWHDEKTIRDPEFLLAQMDLREELAELLQIKDLSGLYRFADNMRGYEKEQEIRLAQSFDDSSGKVADSAMSELQKLMFFRKLRTETAERIALIEDAA